MQVHSKRVTWSLARMPMFRGQQRSEPKTAKLHSFDALRSAPQGCPVSVRMHRDMAARSQSQPLLNFFRNALGLSQRQPGPRCAFVIGWHSCCVGPTAWRL